MKLKSKQEFIKTAKKHMTKEVVQEMLRNSMEVQKRYKNSTRPSNKAMEKRYG